MGFIIRFCCFQVFVFNCLGFWRNLFFPFFTHHLNWKIHLKKEPIFCNFPFCPRSLFLLEELTEFLQMCNTTNQNLAVQKIPQLAVPQKKTAIVSCWGESQEFDKMSVRFLHRCTLCTFIYFHFVIIFNCRNTYAGKTYYDLCLYCFDIFIWLICLFAFSLSLSPRTRNDCIVIRLWLKNCPPTGIFDFQLIWTRHGIWETY